MKTNFLERAALCIQFSTLLAQNLLPQENMFMKDGASGANLQFNNSEKKKFLIALDLDGTLLGTNLRVSPENIKAIQRAQSEGHKIMFCSGRGPQEIEMLYAQQPELKDLLDLDSIPLGASNGCFVIIDGKLHSQVCINKKIILETSRFLESMHYPYLVYTNHGIFISSKWKDSCKKSLLSNYQEYYNSDILLHKETCGVFWHPKIDPSKFFTDFESEVLFSEKYQVITFQKVFIRTIPEMREEMMKKIKEFHEELAHTLENPTLEKSSCDSPAHEDDENKISLITTGPFNIEIMALNGNKAYALGAVAKHFQIPIENTIAIGDSDNDIPMIKFAKIGICMGSGEEYVKEIADFVTLSNDENGVAHALEKFLFSDKNPEKE